MEALKWKAIVSVSLNANHKHRGWQNHLSHYHMLMQHLSDEALGHFSLVLSPEIYSLRQCSRETIFYHVSTDRTDNILSIWHVLKHANISKTQIKLREPHIWRVVKNNHEACTTSHEHYGGITLLLLSQRATVWKTVNILSTLKISLTIKVTDWTDLHAICKLIWHSLINAVNEIPTSHMQCYKSLTSFSNVYVVSNNFWSCVSYYIFHR